MRKQVSKEGVELNWHSGKRSLTTAANSVLPEALWSHRQSKASALKGS